MGGKNMRNGARATRRQQAITPGRGGPTPLRAVIAAVLLALCAALGAAGPATAADGDDLIKVYVVKSPDQTGGVADTLESVATSTLGDPARAGEVFALNRGLAQPDGAALNNQTDALRPGWILRLPQDADGPDVQLARESGNQNASPPPGGAAESPRTDSSTFEIPLPAVLAALGALVLALVTAGIVARRRLRRAFKALARAFRALGEPARRRRRLQHRRSVASRFAGDADSVRRAYGALEEFAAGGGRNETAVHALRVDDAGVTAWLAASDSAAAPWQRLDSTRWRRPAPATAWLTRGAEEGTVSRTPAVSGCLVRVGTDGDGEPVFVDLTGLDGILSVTGDPGVARDVVRSLLAEIARSRPDVPVTVLRGTDGAPPIPVPRALSELPPAEGGRLPSPGTAPRPGTVRAAASRRPVKGLVVLSGVPGEREAAELFALCGPGGAGWTGLVCGEVGGAHWRWRTGSEGTVEIPVLGVTLTVPA
ncbi:hypothetical protein [Streptomyces sp. AK02-01A]|uniref:hypothetical protein n=1 Tax=Streptomyces sp. AK02-01A TaxID=3028648 RepID=UPI0029BB34BE|nr:hypothetical protein [Streptomyces sp. AK02-01A]MDX3854574.1 hypothetical protein [Streptomyces sp. AK02-01A]